MTPSARPSTPSVSRFTGLILGLVVFVCIVLIGVAGFLKYELDQAQALLAAPETASSDQDYFDRLRRSLGYGGFIGSAQNYAVTHDAATLTAMKTQIKAADDLVNHLPDKVPTETRRDLLAIVSTYDAAMAKADKSSTDAAVTFTATDMAPLYAALPILDARVTTAASSNRFVAQSRLEFWAMLLTLVSWCSLIIAAAMCAGIYLSLRDRNSAPLRALSQSVKNMAHGDLRSSIWGMERSDMVGELARAVDLARYHFSQLPDMSLLSDKGPVRIRFEGNAKTMFEAMMQLITRDSEQVRQQAQNLTDTVSRQQQAITELSKQVETVLQNILQRGHTGDQQVKHALQDLSGAAVALKHAQEHAIDQLSRIVPFMQDRAHGLSEITQLTGKQVAQILQSLVVTERNLKNSAEQSQSAIEKLSTTADDLGNRLFGAVNLLQASGKVLAETTETTQSRLNEAIQKLHGPAAAETGVSGLGGDAAERLETLIASLENAHQKLDTVLGEQTEAAKAQIELLTTHSNSLLAQSTTAAQTLSFAADHMRDEQSKFDQTMRHISERMENASSKLDAAYAAPGSGSSEQTQLLLSAVSAQIAELNEKLSAQQSAPPSDSGELSDTLLLEIKSGFETTVRSLAGMREQMANLVINANTSAPMIIPTDNHWRDVAAQIEITRTSLSQLVTQQIERLETRLAGLGNRSETPAPVLPRDAQEQMEQQTQILTELVATLGVLDEHMQQIKSDMHARG